MPPIDAWEAYQRQLAKIDPNCDAGIIRLETGQGMVLTVSATGSPVAETAGSSCFVQPAWSHTPIPVAGSSVAHCMAGTRHRGSPVAVHAPASHAVRGLGCNWKWQVNRNVAGGDLRGGGVRCLWGFGVHVPLDEMTFRLPDSAQTFHSGLGIDAVVGDSGRVVAKVYLNDVSGTPVFRSKPLTGSQSAIYTGNIALASGNSAARQLVLVRVEDGGERRWGKHRSVDIGNHVDWLEPSSCSHPARLRAAVAKYRLAAK